MKKWQRATVERKLREECERFSREVKEWPVKSMAFAFLLGVVLTTYPYQVGSVFVLTGLFLSGLWYFGEYEREERQESAPKVENRECSHEPCRNGKVSDNSSAHFN